MRNLGRLLQFVGLVLLPVSMMLELVESIGVKQMVIMLVFGTVAFYLGRIVEGYARG